MTTAPHAQPAMHKNIRLYLAVRGQYRHLPYVSAIAAVAAEYDMSVGGVKAAVSRAENDTPVESSVALMQYLSENAPRENDSTRRVQAVVDAGRQEIEVHRRRLAGFNGPLYAVFRSDVHLPLQDSAALTLYYTILRDINPVWISALNDSLDNAKLSRWEDRRRLSEQAFDDDVSNLLEMQKVLLDTERVFAYRAKHVAVTGNHDARFAHSDNLTTKDYLTASLMERLADNGVLFSDSIANQNVFRVNDGLYWTHGYSAAKNDTTRAKHNMERSKAIGNIRRDFDLITGHVHKSAKTATPNGMHYTNPCLCDMNPTYMRHKPLWSQGFTVSQFEHDTDHHHTVTVDFERLGDEMVAYWNGTRYTVDIENKRR